MGILRVLETQILNLKSARSLLSTFFVRAARALLCEWRLELGGVCIYDSEDRQFDPRCITNEEAAPRRGHASTS